MPAERRTEAAIRDELAAERQQLASALADLRAEVSAKRRFAVVAAGAVAAGLATAAGLALVRRLGGS